MGEQGKNTSGKIIPFYAVRLGDFVRPVGILVARCRCGHISNLDVVALALRHGPETRLKDLAPRLRCSRCHQKGWIHFEMEFLSDTVERY
jgi:hypothetical protein